MVKSLLLTLLGSLLDDFEFFLCLGTCNSKHTKNQNLLMPYQFEGFRWVLLKQALITLIGLFGCRPKGSEIKSNIKQSQF